MPLLIYGPDYCSAVRWARDNDGVAEVVASEDDEDLAKSVDRLAGDAPHRLRLANAALAAGERYFSYEAALSVFRSALGMASSTRECERVENGARAPLV